MRLVSRSNAFRVGLATMVLSVSLIPRLAFADWPTLGRVVETAIKNQERPRATTDGADGAIVVWQDARSPRVNVFVRRVLASGELDPAWPVDGRALLTDSTSQDTAFDGQQLPVIISDGTGGAIVAWQDGRSLASGLDIFAQHVLASGVVDPAWPANGRALCTVRGDQDNPTIASDGAGGAIVTWMDGRSGVTDVDIFAQHVLASGVVDPNWTAGGVALCTAPAQQDFPNIVSDGSGGAIVTWHDFRPGTTSIDIYAQHVKSSGVVDPAWPVNGRALTLAAGAQLNPTIVSDGVHGAIVSWEDSRAGESHIFAQRVLGSGTIVPGWPVDGLAVCTAPVEQVRPQIAGDGASGAIVTWLDARNGQNHNPFAQHVLGSGAVDPAWPANGRALGLSSGEALEASIVADGSGGAIIGWDEDSFILTNHVLASGLLDPTFPVNGRFMRLLLDLEHSPDLVASSAGAAIIAWADAASGQDFNIFAMIVLTEQTLAVDPGTPASQITFARPSPSPARGPVTLSFALPHAAVVRLGIYDVGGRRVRELMSGIEPAGTHVLAWDLRDESGHPVPAGVCFARLEVEGRALTGRVVTLR
jgi:flagellar hook capping protein FlgD